MKIDLGNASTYMLTQFKVGINADLTNCTEFLETMEKEVERLRLEPSLTKDEKERLEEK